MCVARVFRLNRSISASRSCFKRYQQRFIPSTENYRDIIFFFLQIDSLLSSRNYTTKIRNIIFYVPPLSSSPICTFLIRNSFIARPSGERLALVLYVVWCVLIKNFRLSELPSSLSLHVCSLSLRFLSPLFVKLRGGDIYKSVI